MRGTETARESDAARARERGPHKTVRGLLRTRCSRQKESRLPKVTSQNEQWGIGSDQMGSRLVPRIRRQGREGPQRTNMVARASKIQVGEDAAAGPMRGDIICSDVEGIT